MQVAEEHFVKEEQEKEARKNVSHKMNLMCIPVGGVFQVQVYNLVHHPTFDWIIYISISVSSIMLGE